MSSPDQVLLSVQELIEQISTGTWHVHVIFSETRAVQTLVQAHFSETDRMLVLTDGTGMKHRMEITEAVEIRQEQASDAKFILVDVTVPVGVDWSRSAAGYELRAKFVTRTYLAFAKEGQRPRRS